MESTDYSEILLWLAGTSLAAFLVSLLIFPLVIIRLPVDYFTRAARSSNHSLRRLPLKVVKNLIGGLFILTGFILLFLPGQGILTMILGISLTDFPGKRRLQARIIRTPRVSRSLNWLRHRAGRAPFILPEPEEPNIHSFKGRSTEKPDTQ
jgi:hypothetical protein